MSASDDLFTGVDKPIHVERARELPGDEDSHGRRDGLARFMRQLDATLLERKVPEAIESMKVLKRELEEE